MLEPVIADAERGKERDSERRLEVFGEFHRRINPEPNSCEAGRFRCRWASCDPKKPNASRKGGAYSMAFSSEVDTASAERPRQNKTASRRSG